MNMLAKDKSLRSEFVLERKVLQLPVYSSKLRVNYTTPLWKQKHWILLAVKRTKNCSISQCKLSRRRQKLRQVNETTRPNLAKAFCLHRTTEFARFYEQNTREGMKFRLAKLIRNACTYGDEQSRFSSALRWLSSSANATIQKLNLTQLLSCPSNSPARLEFDARQTIVDQAGFTVIHNKKHRNVLQFTFAKKLASIHIHGCT